MAGLSTVHWHPVAAYLYVLHLDGPALAWEYLRRNPDYQLDWHRHWRRPREAAPRWGLRLLEDPARDARDAHPVWCPGPAMAQLHPDVDPPPDATPFQLWGLPGYKQLRHDGQRLRLTIHLPGCDVRLVLSPVLQDGMPYTHTIRAQEARHARGRLPAGAQIPLDPRAGAALARERPAPAALLELRTLQALDGHLAGASAQELARVLFGGSPAAGPWHADSGLRSKVRRLLRRGESLMHGGYRRLLQNEALEQGRSAHR